MLLSQLRRLTNPKKRPGKRPPLSTITPKGKLPLSAECLHYVYLIRTLTSENPFRRSLRIFLLTIFRIRYIYLLKVKTTAAYYFLLFYTLALCKPILPLLQDELAHVFWKAQHLATVHHHHGDHHAEIEVAVAGKEENGDRQPPTTKTSEPVSVHIVIELLYGFSQVTIHKQQFALTICNVSTISLDKYYPPPKGC
jgi:hypothetical protein